MEKLYTELLLQFPMLAVILIVAYFITEYIKKSQLENNKIYKATRDEGMARYDILNTEFKNEIKENNKALSDLTSRSIVALEKSIETSESIQLSMSKITENQILIIAEITKNK